MRSVRQPGHPVAQRIATVPAGLTPIDTVIPAGQLLLDGLATLLAGPVESACLRIDGGALGPFAYVIPSLPPDASHAAFYSDTRRPPGRSRITAAAVTLGWRDGRPFFHCHALWTHEDGTVGCGHVLPDETMIAAPLHVTGVGLTGARFEVHPDVETGFSLFTPVPTGTAPAGAGQGLALRLAPNQDLITTLEGVARNAGYSRATIHGGVASIIEARFNDASPIENYATELLVLDGVIQGHPDAPPSEMRIAIVDWQGDIRQGHLVRGDNPVLMTFEAVMLRAAQG